MKKENEDRNGESETNIAKSMPESLKSLPPLEQRRQTRISELMQLEEEYIVEIDRIIAKWKKVFGKLQIKDRSLSEMKDIQREIDEVLKVLKKSFDDVSLQRTPFLKEKVNERFFIDSIGCLYFNKVPEILANYDVLMEYDNEEQIEAFEDLSINSLTEELYVTTSDILDSLTHYFLRLQVCLKHVLSCTPRKHPDHHPLREIVQVLNKVNKENSSRKFGDIEKVRSESCPLPDIKKQSKVKRRYSWDNGTLKKFAKITRSMSFVRNSKKHSSERKNDGICQETLKKDEFVKEFVTTLDGSLKRCSTPKTKSKFEQLASRGQRYNVDNHENKNFINRKIINREGTSNASFAALEEPIKSYSNIKNNILVDRYKISDSNYYHEFDKQEFSGKVLAIPESSPTLIRGNLDFYSYNAENSISESKRRSTKKGSLTPEDLINLEHLDVPKNTSAEISNLSDEDSRLDKYIEEKTQSSYRVRPNRELQTRVCSHVEKKKSAENRKISSPDGQLFKNQLNRMNSKQENTLNHEASHNAAENDNRSLKMNRSNETIKPRLGRLIKSRTLSDSATLTDDDINCAESERRGRRIKYKSIDNEEGTTYNTHPVTCSTKHPLNSYEASMSPSLLVRTDNVIMNGKSKCRNRKYDSELKTRINSTALLQLKEPTLNGNASSHVNQNCESDYSKKQTVKIEGANFAEESKLLDDSSNDSAANLSNSRESDFPESSLQTNCVSLSLSTSTQGKDAFTQRRNFSTGKENFNLTICSDFNKTVRSMLEASLSCVELYRNGITYGNSTFYCASNSNDNKKGRSVSTITSPSSHHQPLTKSLSNPSTSSVNNDDSSVNAVLNVAEFYQGEFGGKVCHKEAEGYFKARLGSFEVTKFPTQKHTWQNKNSCNGNTIDTPALNVRKLVDKKRQLSKARIFGWSAGIDSLLLDKNGIKVFQIFLRLEYSEENLLFWLACESFKSLSSSKIVKEALKIYRSYIEANSAKEVNLDHETRVKIKEAIKNPNKNMFDQAQKRIKYLMAQDSYPRFIKSSMYQGMME